MAAFSRILGTPRFSYNAVIAKYHYVMLCGIYLPSVVYNFVMTAQ